MYIGVDCGTQSTKVVVVDGSDGRIAGEASRPHKLEQGDHGRREQRVEEWTAAPSTPALLNASPSAPRNAAVHSSTRCSRRP